MVLINKITPYIGAEIKGVDFSKVISDEEHKLIYNALIENLVIFFRETKISPRKHVEFSELFGDLDLPHPVYPSVEGFSQIVKLENHKDNPPDTYAWHTDLTFKDVQPFASVLVAGSVPKIGGDTLWSSCYQAYERLPDGMKEDLASIKAIHDMGDFRNCFSVSRDGNTGVERLKDGMSKLGQNIRNLIEVHPVSKRKYLNFNETFVSHIVGKTTNDSNSLKTFLGNHMNKPEDQVRWRWQNGDLVMWDNRVTMHYAIADYMREYRCMNRVTIINDKRITDS